MAKWRHELLSISDKTLQNGRRSMESAAHFFRLLHDAQVSAIGTDMEIAPRSGFIHYHFTLRIKCSL